MSTETSVNNNVLLYNKYMLYISCHFGPLKPLMLWMDQVKLLDVLTSLPVSHSILPRVVCFASAAEGRHLSQSEDAYL